MTKSGVFVQALNSLEKVLFAVRASLQRPVFVFKTNLLYEIVSILQNRMKIVDTFGK